MASGDSFVFNEIRGGWGVVGYELNIEPSEPQGYPPSREGRLLVVRAGFPLSALECDLRADYLNGTASSVDWHDCIPAPEWLNASADTRAAPRTPQPIPLRPMWAGLAFNTVFYAAGLYALRHGPRTLRREARRGRGHCPECGYDRLGAFQTPCPECGHTGAL